MITFIYRIKSLADGREYAAPIRAANVNSANRAVFSAYSKAFDVLDYVETDTQFFGSITCD